MEVVTLIMEVGLELNYGSWIGNYGSWIGRFEYQYGSCGLVR